MQFNKLRLVGLYTIDLPIYGAAPSDRFACINVDGLGPVAVDVAIGTSTIQGGTYQGRRPQNREVVVTVGLQPNYQAMETSESLRTQLYGLLTPGVDDNVDIQIMNNNTVLAHTVGYVSKMETSLFDKDPVVAITLECTQPYLQSPTDVRVTNQDLRLPQFTNVGTAPSGFLLEAKFTEDMTSWVIYNIKRTKKMQFLPRSGSKFLANDILRVDTRPGSRKIELVRGTATYNRLEYLTRDSNWMMLYGGLNEWIIGPQTYVLNSLVYTPQYWGV